MDRTGMEPSKNRELVMPGVDFRARLLDSLYDGVYFVDRHRRITYWNEGAEELTGYKAEEVVGTHCADDLLMHVDATGRHLCMGACPLVDAIARGCRLEHEVTLRHKSGHRVPVRVRVSPIRDEAGRIIGAVEVFSDVTNLKLAERRAGEMETLAFRDALTSLPNRRFVHLKVEQALEEVRQFGRHYGLMVMDVDHFKAVNDQWGHATGDGVLQAVAHILSECVRPWDTVGRWGGEEFLIVVADVKTETLLELAERCRTFVGKHSIPAQEALIHLTISVGATLLRAEDTAETAVNRADQLMYQSKSKGRNRILLG